jgi:hypothetical protein
VHLTTRTGIGGLLVAIGALGVSCQDSSNSGCNTAPGGTTTPPSFVLQPRYVLITAAAPHAPPLPVPAYYGDSAGFRLTAVADTLTFNADSTYREGGVTTLTDAGGTATARSHASPTPLPAFHVGSTGAGSLVLPSFMGRAAIVAYANDQLTVYTAAGTDPYGGPIFQFLAR